MPSIEPARAQELLSRLVEIPSVTHSEKEACDYLAQALSMHGTFSLGWDRVRVDAVGNVVAEKGEGGREIVLMGHIDTVPGGPPFRVDGNILWGRGSVDAKGPLCTFVVAAGAADVPPGWKLTLIAAVGEEGDSRGARHVIPDHAPAACLIGEPSGTNGITIGYRGYLRLQIAARDEGAHRSGDSGPITACLLAAADILRDVERRDDVSRPVIERPSGAVIAMHGLEAGERTGFVDLDVRLPIGAVPETWAEEFMEISARYRVETRFVASMPAHLVSRNDPLARVLRVAVREAGLSPRLLAKGGTADFNLAAAWNCPMAAYGPGDSKLDHTAEEHIDLSEYLSAVFILKSALENFMNT